MSGEKGKRKAGRRTLGVLNGVEFGFVMSGLCSMVESYRRCHQKGGGLSQRIKQIDALCEKLAAAESVAVMLPEDWRACGDENSSSSEAGA